MAELSEIKDKDTGAVYGIKDATARAAIEELKQNGTGGTTTETITETDVVVSIEADAGEEIMVEADTTEAVTLVHQGKNLLYGRTTPITNRGVTLTPNADGTYHVSGSVPSDSTVNASLGLIETSNKLFVPAGTYAVSTFIPNSNIVSITVNCADLDIKWGGTFNTPNGIITYPEDAYVHSSVAVKIGASVDCDVWVQLERVDGDKKWTDFEKAERQLLVVNFPTTVTAFEGENTLYTTTGDVLTVRVTRNADYDCEKKIEEITKALKFDPTVYGLRVLTLDGNCAGMTKDDYVTLAYTFKDKNGYALKGNVDVKKQGSSSVQTGVEIGANFDDDLGGLFNFTLKFPEAFEANEGWTAQTKYCFKANAIDHSHSRNICSCKLWGESVKSRANVPVELANLVNGGAIDGFPIVIVLNGKFYALGTFNIPKDGWMFGSPKAILCADDHTDATKFKALATLNGDFELEYVEDEDNADWVLTSINTAIQAVIDGNLDTVGQYIDIPSAIDYYIHTVYEQATDGTDKNYILVTFDGVKWYFSNYDRDTVYGIWWNGKSFISPASRVMYADYASSHKLMNLIYTNRKAELKERSTELRNSVLSEANVATVFTNFGAGIPAELLAQNCRRWPLLRSTSVNNLHQILNWYRMRCQVVDKEIEAL